MKKEKVNKLVNEMMNPNSLPIQYRRINDINLQLNMVVHRFMEDIGEETFIKKLEEKAPYLKHKTFRYGTRHCDYTLLEIVALEEVFETRLIRIGDYDDDYCLPRKEVPKKKVVLDIETHSGLLVITPDKGIIDAKEDV